MPLVALLVCCRLFLPRYDFLLFAASTADNYSGRLQILTSAAIANPSAFTGFPASVQSDLDQLGRRTTTLVPDRASKATLMSLESGRSDRKVGLKLPVIATEQAHGTPEGARWRPRTYPRPLTPLADSFGTRRRSLFRRCTSGGCLFGRRSPTRCRSLARRSFFPGGRLLLGDRLG